MICCPLCRAVARTTLYRHTRSGDVHRCTACGMVYADPRGDGQGSGMPHCKDHPEAYRQNAAQRLSVLGRVTGVRGGKLLDVGCFDGSFALAAREMGFTVQGVESEAEPAAKAQARGVPTVPGRFEDVKISGPFDVVAMMHTLEHLEDPWAALARARDLLKPGGALLLELPNFDCRARRLTGRYWRQFIWDHFHFFEPASLRRLLVEGGFSVKLLQPAAKVASLRLLADRVERYYSRGLGKAIASALAKTGLSEKTISLRPGDIMLAVATVREAD